MPEKLHNTGSVSFSNSIVRNFWEFSDSFIPETISSHDNFGILWLLFLDFLIVDREPNLDLSGSIF